MNPTAKYDLIIIGAGPAGMSAAKIVANSSLKVLILDEQAQAGGQIYRNVMQSDNNREYLGRYYFAGTRLVRNMQSSNINTQFNASVWKVEETGNVYYTVNGRVFEAVGKFIIIAIGAQERPCPFPGWTLPGVMTCGAAQIMMKSSRLIPSNAILAGSGPLIYLLAAQMLDAGKPPLALVETQPKLLPLKALFHIPAALKGWQTLINGVALLAKIQRAGIKRYVHATEFSAIQKYSGKLQFNFKHNGQQHQIESQTLLVHQGIIPNTHLTRSANIQHCWHEIQRNWYPKVNEWGRTNINKILIAGDGAKIGGADIAMQQGHLAGLEILQLSNQIDEKTKNTRAKLYQKKLKTAFAPRALLDRIYATPKAFRVPIDKTIICRCEEI
ncbi:MAG: FAD-dependent oxidoreductase, partial [Rhizobiales bacterium]|nr:FAD-dependent oxidoreductase [Hyphomicrobiales bacterium]